MTVRHLQWTCDGNFLSVVVAGGQVHTYMMSMPVVSAHLGSSVAYMKSLREVIGTQFACFASTKSHILPRNMLLGAQVTCFTSTK